MDCPKCLPKGIKGSLLEVGDDKLFICKTEDCDFIESTVIPTVVKMVPITRCRNRPRVKYGLLKDIDLSSSDDDDDDKISDNGYDNIDHVFKVDSIKRLIHKLMHIDTSKKRLYNWLNLPLMLKLHIRLIIFTLIHVNIINHKTNKLIMNLRRSFYVAQDLVRKVPKHLSTLLSFNFATLMYNEKENFSIPFKVSMNIIERYINGMTKFLEAVDDNSKMKAGYLYNEKCCDCSHEVEYVVEDYFIKIKGEVESCKEYNCIKYVSQCRKCVGKCIISISLKRLPNFIFLTFPNGLETSESVRVLQQLDLRTSDKRLYLQAIMEFDTSKPYVDVPEQEPHISQFAMRYFNRTMSYVIHVKISDSWYSLKKLAGYLIEPKKESSVIIKSKNVGLMIFACNSDPESENWNEHFLPITEELMKYKKPPADVSVYPVKAIKHHIFLSKCRDLCLNHPNFNTEVLISVAQEMTDKLNNYMTRRKIKASNREELDCDVDEIKTIAQPNDRTAVGRNSKKETKKRKRRTSRNLVVEKCTDKTCEDSQMKWRKVDYKNQSNQTEIENSINRMIILKQEQLNGDG